MISPLNRLIGNKNKGSEMIKKLIIKIGSGRRKRLNINDFFFKVNVIFTE
jgi:hypothetical protein